MFRRTQNALVLPLPVYKIAGVLVRQFSRPIVLQLLKVCEEHPKLRSTFIYVGWVHFRTSVTLHQMIWGAEQKQQIEKEKEDKEEAAASATPSSDGAAAAADANKKPTTTTTTTTTTSAPANANNDAAEAAAESPLTAPRAPNAAFTATISLGGLKPAAPAPAAAPTPEPATPAPAAATPEPKSTASSNTNISATAATTPPRAISSPRSLRILPRALNPMVQVRNVRRIFVAPPRPSDKELLETGMKLVVEVLMFCVLLMLLAYEMYRTAQEKKEKRVVLEDRFKRLEDHMLNCPGGFGDADEPPQQPRGAKGKKQPAVPAATTATTAAKTSTGDKTAAATDDKKPAAAAATANTTAAGTPAAVSSGDAAKASTATAPAVATSAAVATTVKSTTTTTTADGETGGLEAKPRKRVWIVAMAAQMSSLQDLWDAFLALPVDVRSFLVAFFLVPYMLMGAACTRLLLRR